MATVVNGNLMVPFSDKYYTEGSEGRYSIPWIAPLYLYPYLIMLSTKQVYIRYHFFFFLSLVWLDLWFSPGLPDQ